MDIERLAKKLAPLMPEQVGQWLRARRLAKPELRDLIDKQIIAAAQRHLGDPHQVPLLSLPPEKTARGEINLGTVVYDQPKWPLGIDLGELLQSLSIFGRAGSGKTNLVFHVLRQLDHKRIPFLFLDWKQTARHMLPLLERKAHVHTPGRSLSPMRFSPFIVPPGIDAQTHRNHLVDVMSDAYVLGEGARSLVQQALVQISSDRDAIQIDELIGHVERTEAKQRQLGWKMTALRALNSIKLAGLGGNDDVADDGISRQFFAGNNIVELDGLNHSSKKMLVPLLCLWLYQAALVSGIRERLRLVVILEEAHHFLYGEQSRSRESLLEMLLRQCREVGIGFIIVDQHPHLISSAALGNSFASVCMNLKDPRDISKAAALSGVPEDEKRLISKLSVGRGIVRLQDRWTEPAFLQIPLIEVQKGAVSDDILAKSLEKSGSGSGPMRRLVREIGQVRRFPLMDSQMNERGFALIEDVVLHPDDGVKARYRRLGLGGSTGNSLKERLLEKGWLEAEAVAIGTSRKLVLRLSRAAHELIGLEHQKVNRESIAHAYWKRFYAKQLEQQGYHVQIEAHRNGGFADVVASMNGQRVAVEIETGKSDFIANVKACLAARFSCIAVVATSNDRLRFVEQCLAKAGLLLPKRIQLIQAGATALARPESERDGSFLDASRGIP